MSVLKRITPSKRLVKESMRGHAWIGLFFGALLYLICLSGTLLVFLPEIERWEQPKTEEYLSIDSQNIQKAIAQMQNKFTEPISELYFIYPSENLPKAHVSANDMEWWVDAKGNLTEPVDTQLAALITDLHYYLHLPKGWGMILVGVLGAMMVALMISGLLSHPNLFKDAFKLRLGDNRHLEQTDIHNRLSVWGLPFFFIISVTGAYIGLFGVAITVFDWFEPEHNTEQMIEVVFGEDPEITQSEPTINTELIEQDLANREPTATPIYLVVHKPGTSQQYVELAATLPGRLVYSEIYRYHSDGRFINDQNLADGSWSRQVAYSTYRLHFGQFGGLTTRLLYFLLGMAMTVITVTGINMWFEKRRVENKWYAMWQGFVWATPLSIAIATFLTVVVSVSGALTFWLPLILLTSVAVVVYVNLGPMGLTQLLSIMKHLSFGLLFLVVFAHSFTHMQSSWHWFFSFCLISVAILPLVNYRKILFSEKRLH